METSNPAPAPPPIIIPVNSASLKKEWLLIGIAAAVVAALLTIDMVTFPEESARGQRTPLTFVAVIVTAFTHGAWITLDRNRRGRTVGIWRFGAILLGPIAIGIYLLAEYRLRALYLIPARLGIYIGV